MADVLTFAPFFDALAALKGSSTENVRVLHFGDSQLEGDRITIRFRMPTSVVTAVGVQLCGFRAFDGAVLLAFNNSEGFIREAVFGRRDTAFEDMKYGHLGSFTLLAQKDSAYEGAFLTKLDGATAVPNFTTAKIHLEGAAPTKAEILVADTLFSTESFLKMDVGARCSYYRRV